MNESLHLYLTGTEIFVRRERGLPWRRSVTPVGQGRWDGTDLKAASIDLPSQRSWHRRNLHVYLGSALCRFLVTTLPEGLRDDAERQAAAGAQMMHQLGLDVSEWQFALDVVAQPQSNIVCAVRQALMRQLRGFADAYRLELASVRPFATVVWNTFQSKASNATCALLVVEDDAFTLFASTVDGLEAINTLTHRREGDMIDREARRIALAANAQDRSVHLALPEHLNVMAPTSAAQALRDVDYLDRGYYADFRDLLFRSVVEGAA